MAHAISNGPQSNEVLTIDLSRALTRLQQKILSSPLDSRLRYSSYERAKTSANLEYARTLLLRLEQAASSIKVQSRKQAAQDDLIRQRALIKRLSDALHDLDRQDPSPDYPSSAEEEDLLGDGDVSPPSPTSSASSFSKHEPPPPPPPPPPPITVPPTSTLRNRHHPSVPDAAPESTSPSSSAVPILESDAATQANLTNSLLSLATALKNSSLAMSDSIALDAETLSRATDGLDRNTTGMQAAGKRMGLLKRMTEGKGWWGRMMLYAWIGGLWILALVIVFVLPKLRF